MKQAKKEQKRKNLKQLQNVEKVIRELKLLIEKEHAEGNIKSELFDLIKGKLEQAKIKRSGL